MSFPFRCLARRHALRLRISLRSLLGLVLVIAVILAGWTHYRQANVPWQRVGGMIGWNEAQIVARLGPPARTIESDVTDPVMLAIGPPPSTGSFRTLIFDTIDGTFVARLNSDGSAFTCFRSIWVERNCYY
jgi:hypothetical protein